MYLHIYIERWFLELGFQAKFNHSLKDPGFHLPERGSPARGRRHHLSFPCDFGHGPATPHLEDQWGEPIAGSQPCGDSPRISGGFLGTTSEILIQQVWSKSQKLPGSGEYLAGDLRTRVPVFTSSYSKLPPRSFIPSLDPWPAELLCVVLTSHPIQCKWPVFEECLLGCPEHLMLATEEEETWRTITNEAVRPSPLSLPSLGSHPQQFTPARWFRPVVWSPFGPAHESQRFKFQKLCKLVALKIKSYKHTIKLH